MAGGMWLQDGAVAYFAELRLDRLYLRKHVLENLFYALWSLFYRAIKEPLDRDWLDARFVIAGRQEEDGDSVRKREFEVLANPV